MERLITISQTLYPNKEDPTKMFCYKLEWNINLFYLLLIKYNKLYNKINFSKFIKKYVTF